MRNLLLAALLFCVMTSCSKDAAMDEMQTEFTADQYPQKWDLVSMSGNMANVPPATGADMTWQEYYIFNEGTTFSKTRQQNGTTTVATGTYSVQTLSDGKYLLLTYSSSSTIIGTCSGDKQEALKLAENSLQNTWNACDGPGLVYKRVTFTGNGN